MEDALKDGGDGSADLALFMSESSSAAAASIPGKVASPAATTDEDRLVCALRDAYRRMLSVPPRMSRKSCTGDLQEADQLLVAVRSPVDTIARTYGHSAKGALHLCPEEWLLSYERGSLRVASLDGRADTWAAALGGDAGLDLDVYRAYAILRRLGHVAVRGMGVLATGSGAAMTRYGFSQHAPMFSYGKYQLLIGGGVQSCIF
ncbi:hypothetical protein GGF46_002294 [Coemansia sp. RSA 552]|nr:hypothetical protein GGF46_002294 [Coemansia sp. RSA 552]